jgi:recombination directionality factor gp3-like protein
MAIVGLTGRGARFPEIGKLFKGAKKEKKTNSAGREYETFGKELDHWRFESSEPHIIEAFNAAFAEADGKPQEIPVYLPFSRTEENFDAWQESYAAGGLLHRCDGRDCVLWFDDKSQTYRTDPKQCPTLAMTPDRAKRDGCKPVARLRVVIPALNQLGFVTVETHSKNDILHLDAALPAYESLRPEGLRGIPMLLCRVKKSISTPGDGKRARRDKWLIQLKPHPEWAALYLDSQRQAALASVASPLLLTTNLTEEDEDNGELDAPADTERERVICDLREIYIGKGKTEAQWDNYHAIEIGPRSTDNLKALLVKWQAIPKAQAAAATQSAPVVPQTAPPVEEEIHEGEIAEVAESTRIGIRADIEDTVKLLHETGGCSTDHINAKIARITGGVYALDEIEEEHLPKVRQMLNGYVALGVRAAKEMAKEVRK